MAKKRDGRERKLLLFMIVLAGLSLFLLGYTIMLEGIAKSKLAEALENARKPAVSLEILPYDCDGCLDVWNLSKELENAANITEIKEGEGSGLAKFLPAIIIRGDAEKLRNITGLGRLEGDVLIIEDTVPPYYSVKEGRVVGLVDATVESCEGCFDIYEVIDYFRSTGVAIADMRNGSVPSETSPAILLTGDYAVYNLSGRETAQGLVIEPRMPPYLNKTTGRIEGIVKLTYIIDSSCEECYDPAVHERILRSMGLEIGSAATFDLSKGEGMDLVRKYNITAVPTIILSREALLYPGFSIVWSRVGSIEDDALVFRDTGFMESAGGYKPLS